MRSLNDPASGAKDDVALPGAGSAAPPAPEHEPAAPVNVADPSDALDEVAAAEQAIPHLTVAPRPFPYVDFGAPGRSQAGTGAPRLRVNHTTATYVSDFVAIVAGPLAAALVTGSMAVFLASALLVFVTKTRARHLALSEMEMIGIAPLAAALGATAIFAGAGSDELRLALTGAAAAIVAGGGAALVLRFGANRIVRSRVAVIGSAVHAHELAWELQNDRNRRYEVVGYVTRNGGPRDRLADLQHVSFRIRRLGALAELEDVVAEHGIDLLVLSDGSERLEVFERAAHCGERNGTRLLSLAAFNELVFQRVAIDELNSAWLQHLIHPRYRPAPRALVRAIDLTGAALLAIVTAPLWLATAAAIKLEDRGPVFYRQLRCGAGGRTFTILKFRSMRTDAEAHGAQWSSTEDDRITRVGAVIRRLHIDELPQLANVLRGDMSLVGPRPERPEFVYRLEQDVPFYSRRHLVKPGITGWAQVRAGYGFTDEGAVVKLSRDLFYLKHQSLFLYCYVLLATGWTVVTGSVHARAQ